jgi:hypothetical protein
VAFSKVLLKSLPGEFMYQFYALLTASQEEAEKVARSLLWSQVVWEWSSPLPKELTVGIRSLPYLSR